MRKLILKMSLSVDGFVGGPNGEIDWLFGSMDDSAVQWIQNTLWEAGVHIMGSRTFHDMVAYWPTSTQPLAAAMNEIPKIVFSRKGVVELTNLTGTTQAIKDKIKIDNERGMIQPMARSPFASSWTNPTVASGELKAEIIKLKSQGGKPILAHGGASFAQSLVSLGLIDEYRLVIHPVVLGHGLPLFSMTTFPTYLNLKSSTVFESGIIANIYTPYKP